MRNLRVARLIPPAPPRLVRVITTKMAQGVEAVLRFFLRRLFSDRLDFDYLREDARFDLHQSEMPVHDVGLVGHGSFA